MLVAAVIAVPAVQLALPVCPPSPVSCRSAPELLLGRRCDGKADIYSFGVCLWCVLISAVYGEGNNTSCGPRLANRWLWSAPLVVQLLAQPARPAELCHACPTLHNGGRWRVWLLNTPWLPNSPCPVAAGCAGRSAPASCLCAASCVSHGEAL